MVVSIDTPQKIKQAIQGVLCIPICVSGRPPPPPPSPGKKGQYPLIGHISPTTAPFWELEVVNSLFFLNLPANKAGRKTQWVAGWLAIKKM